MSGLFETGKKTLRKASLVFVRKLCQLLFHGGWLDPWRRTRGGSSRKESKSLGNDGVMDGKGDA